MSARSISAPISGAASPSWTAKAKSVGGIVVMRYGENALNVIDGIKKKIEEIKPSLPEGVRIVPTYDRSDLIKRAIATLREKLIEESIVVALVCVVFLWHVRSALVAIITLPDRDHSLLHPDVVDERDLKHHVARRHCHRHRRDGRFGDHHDRERAQVRSNIFAKNMSASRTTASASE